MAVRPDEWDFVTCCVTVCRGEMDPLCCSSFCCRLGSALTGMLLGEALLTSDFADPSLRIKTFTGMPLGGKTAPLLAGMLIGHRAAPHSDSGTVTHIDGFGGGANEKGLVDGPRENEEERVRTTSPARKKQKLRGENQQQAH